MRFSFSVFLESALEQKNHDEFHGDPCPRMRLKIPTGMLTLLSSFHPHIRVTLAAYARIVRMSRLDEKEKRLIFPSLRRTFLTYEIGLPLAFNNLFSRWIRSSSLELLLLSLEFGWFSREEILHRNRGTSVMNFHLINCLECRIIRWKFGLLFVRRLIRIRGKIIVIDPIVLKYFEYR